LATLLASLLSGEGSRQVHATAQVTGAASSTVIPCLPVGPDYLVSPSPTPYEMTQTVELQWTGPATSARLIAYEFGAPSGYGRNIYVNGQKIGAATGTRNGQTLCRGFEGLQPLVWEFAPAILVPGVNTVKINLDPANADQGWGLSRVQIEIAGPDVDGPSHRQVTITSSYFNNWQDYQNEGTWTHIMVPSSYDPAEPTPLLIAAHGYNDSGLTALLDYREAAEARGWLLASADYHGEVNNDFFDIDPATGQPRLRVGLQTMGSRASQWDVLNVVHYMQANYDVDPSRIYLIGHSMGGMTALLTGARRTDLVCGHRIRQHTNRSVAVGGTGRHRGPEPQPGDSARMRPLQRAVSLRGHPAQRRDVSVRVPAAFGRRFRGQLPASSAVDPAPGG